MLPRGDKSKSTDKQERTADHVAENDEGRVISEMEAKRRASATVNKDERSKKNESGSGRQKSTGHEATHKRGPVGGKAPVLRSSGSRSASVKKAVATRKRNAEHSAHS